jgi:hypothetical protein
MFQNTFTNVRTCEMEDKEVACEIHIPTALFEIDGALQIDTIYNTQ